MNLYNHIIELDEFFTSIRRHEDYIVVDLKLPINWQDKYVLDKRGNKVQLKIGNKNNTSKIVSFYTLFAEEETTVLLEEIRAIIKFNKDIAEKDNLLSVKMAELKKTFSENNIDSLRNLEFNFTPNLELNENKENGRLVEEGAIERPSGDITT